MNCESAARVFLQLAKDMGIQGLQAFFFKAGDKYKIERKGVQVKLTELVRTPPSSKYLVKDDAFIQKPMTNLR